jgi:hypothetical protein
VPVLFCDLAGGGLAETVETADVLISTVPADAAASHAAVLAGIPVLLDAIYDPWPTPLARAVANAARETEVATQRGLACCRPNLPYLRFHRLPHGYTTASCWLVAVWENRYTNLTSVSARYLNELEPKSHI